MKIGNYSVNCQSGKGGRVPVRGFVRLHQWNHVGTDFFCRQDEWFSLQSRNDVAPCSMEDRQLGFLHVSEIWSFQDWQVELVSQNLIISFMFQSSGTVYCIWESYPVSAFHFALFRSMILEFICKSSVNLWKPSNDCINNHIVSVWLSVYPIYVKRVWLNIKPCGKLLECVVKLCNFWVSGKFILFLLFFKMLALSFSWSWSLKVMWDEN